MAHTQSFRTSDQLFVCFGGQQKGKAVSKQRLAHWIVEAIVLAYQARCLPCPLCVRTLSMRDVSSSWALVRGASIADICRAAGWVTTNKFARFYNLHVEPMASNTRPTRCQSRLLCHSPLRTGYVRFLCFSVNFPLANPVEIPGGGAPDARSSTRVYAQGQPLCWARCPCVVIPHRVIPHVHSSTVRLPSRSACVFPWQRPFAISAV